MDPQAAGILLMAIVLIAYVIHTLYIRDYPSSTVDTKDEHF